MAILESRTILEHNLFKQRDGRDALGIWTLTSTIAGDASGGTIKLRMLPRSPDRIFAVVALGLSSDGLLGDASAKYRLLCNFPPADPDGGLDSTDFTRAFVVSSAGLTVPNENWAASTEMNPGFQHLLLWGSALPGVIQPIVELEMDDNAAAVTAFFDGWGYFWDRAVMYEPGGPRFPLES